ncbi:MAG: S8 family serine peptidase [bacterium]|nr:S8 family serine peptidase [bacterium]
MKTPVMILLLALLAAGSAFAVEYENSRVVGHVPDRLLVTLAVGVTPNPDKAAGPDRMGVPALDAVAQRYPLRRIAPLYAGMTDNFVDKSIHNLLDREYAIDLTSGADLEAAKAAYEALPEVERVHYVAICKVDDAYLPNDPGLPSQWHLRASGYGKDIRAVGAWGHTLGDTNVVVAVIDTGVDWNHPDLGGTHPDKVNGSIWTNWAEYHGTPGVDDDSNGYVDDIRGWDWVDVGDEGYPLQDDTTPDNDPSDYAGHGTNCSGCIAPVTDNSTGIAATAPGVKIMALRAGWLPRDAAGAVVRMDYCAQAMVYAANNGANVINCSWGSSSYLLSAVATCQSANVLIVASAGNDADEVSDYLATRSGVMSVAATDQGDSKADFSSYGTWVELSAPGVAIYTTHFDGSSATSTYASVQGTSFSAPITAGAAALVWSANPGLSYSQVADILMNSADPIDALNPGLEGKLGAGRLNLLAALGDHMHRFPEEFPTLYDAMNSAAPGDTVGVLGGAVLSDIASIPDGVKVFGGYNADYLSRDPLGNPSVIQGASHKSTVSFHSAGPTTELDGFLIQGGGGSLQSGVPGTARCGGGVLIQNQSPTLRNLTITGNSVGSASTLGAGAGIMMSGSSSLIEDVIVTGNTGIHGGAFYAYQSSPTLVRCSLSSSTLTWDNPTFPPKGGGVHAIDSELTMIDCLVQDNGEVVRGGGIYLEQAGGTASLTMTGGEVSGNTSRERGSGVFQLGGTADLTRVHVHDNVRSTLATFAGGGGLSFDGATVVADSMTVLDNTAHNGAGFLFENCPDAQVTNSVLAGNASDYYGGAIAYQNCTAGGSIGNTIADNAAPAAGAGGIYVATTAFTMANTILALNTGGTSLGNGLGLASGSAAVSCSDVWGNANADWSGLTDPTGTDGNISADPQLCHVDTRDFTVGNTSPCRPAYSGGCGLIGALDGLCDVSAVGDGEIPDGVPTVFRVEQNFPNPFNPKTVIRFSLPEAGRTVVTIFDVRGRRVNELLNEDLAANTHEVSWTGLDKGGRQVSAGVYFYKVSSGDHQAVGRMALVK